MPRYKNPRKDCISGFVQSGNDAQAGTELIK